MTKDQLSALDHLLDDHYALWDFGDGLPQFRPSTAQSKNAELLELVRQGLVTITYGRWHKNDTEPCELETALSAIADPAMWHPTNGMPGYVVELSDSGYRELESRGIGKPIAD